jgi:hypothetical protein
VKVGMHGFEATCLACLAFFTRTSFGTRATFAIGRSPRITGACLSFPTWAVGGVAGSRDGALGSSELRTLLAVLVAHGLANLGLAAVVVPAVA